MYTCVIYILSVWRGIRPSACRTHKKSAYIYNYYSAGNSLGIILLHSQMCVCQKSAHALDRSALASCAACSS